MEQLQERLRQHRPEDLSLKKEFLHFQAYHFDLKWSELLLAFTNRQSTGKTQEFGELNAEEFTRYLVIEDYPRDLDLSSFVTIFGQRGMEQMTSLNDFEKNAVVDLAKYQLATYYQLIDELGNFKGINLDRILQQADGMNLINIAKVAANLSSRIKNDYSLYLSKTIEMPATPPLPNETSLEYIETSENGVAFYKGAAGLEARVNDKRVAFLPAGKRSSAIIRETSYSNLAFLLKYDIISRFSEYISNQEKEQSERTLITFKEEVVSANTFFYSSQDAPESEEVEMQETEEAPSQPLALQSITMEWFEASPDQNAEFETLQNLQDYLTHHFVRTKEEYDNFIEGGGEHHYYDKTKLHFDFGNSLGQSYRLTSRVDMGFGNGNFNPYLQSISAYVLSNDALYFEQQNLSTASFTTLSLPQHQYSNEVIALLQAEGDLNERFYVGHSFETIIEAYTYGRHSSVFREQFPTIEGYIAYLSQPYPLETIAQLEDTDQRPSPDIELEETELREKIREFVASEDYYLWHWESLLELGASQDIIDEYHNAIPNFSFTLEGLSLEESSNHGASGYLALNDVSIDEDSINDWLLEHSDGTLSGRREAFEQLTSAIEEAWDDVKSKHDSQLDSIVEKYQLGQEKQVENDKLSELQEEFSVGTRYIFDNNRLYQGEFLVTGIRQEESGRFIVSLEQQQGTFIYRPVVSFATAEEVRERLRRDNPVMIEQELTPEMSEVQDDNSSSIPVQDFSFPADLTNFYPQTPTDKVNANLAAIRLIKELEREGLQATLEQQEVLAKYVGWGGLANTFFNTYDIRFENERYELQELLTPSEYDAMKESSLTAYYTDPAIIREMWQKLVADGFTGGRILDPSMGTGNFFATMPKEIRENSELYGVELDPITGAIARQLQPNANIQIKGFEETQFNDGAFDLVISNIPFANVRIADTRYDRPYVIHDYFVKRSMDLLRDGGQLNIISSTGTMDKRTGNIVRELEPTINFLGGIRLPDTAFRKIAGTDVTTDILYFQKNERKLSYEDKLPFSLAFKPAMQFPKDNRVWINPFFGRIEEQYNSFVLGEFEVKKFNGGTLSLKAISDQLISDIQEAMEYIAPALPIERGVLPEPIIVHPTYHDIPEGLAESIPLYSFAYSGDTVYYRDNTSIRVGTRVEDISFYVDDFGNFKDWADNPSKRLIEQYQQLGVTDETALDIYQSEKPAQRGKNKGYYKKTVFFENPLSEREINRIKGMIEIRDTYQDLINIQRNHGYDQFVFEQLLTKLNETYDSFVKKYGYLNSTVNRNLFDSDDRYSLLASLEDEYIDDVTKKVEYKKSLAFERALIRPERVIHDVTTAKDALNASIAEGRGVDFSFMKSIYKGKSDLDLIDELGDEIIPNPTNIENVVTPIYLPRNQFLSGDVVTRLEEIEDLIASGNTSHEWGRYKEMLEAVRPERITLTDIDYKIGSRWIPERVYSYFAAYTFNNVPIEDFDDRRLEGILKTNPLDHKIEYVSGGLSLYSSSTDIQLGVSSSRHDLGRKIFLNLLNSYQATITKKVVDEEGKERNITDVEKTAELRAKESEIQELFREFVDRRPELQKVIEDTYNSLYNRTITREYDGSHLEIDGLASNIELRPHQKNAIQRIIEERRALLAHEVGSGKTLTMLGAGFKMKELGMVQKPLYVVPSSLTAQFGQEIMKFFPTKNVFVTTKKDFIKSNRKQFISRIITGDYDAIVIGDSQFEKIPMSKEKQELYIQDKLTELREMKENTPDGATVKQIEASIKGFKEQLLSLQELSQDSFIEFENLGIDCLFVDEAHHFKNIRPVTSLGNVAGITQKTSKKNIDMEMKVRQIQSENDDTGIIFATGTPVSNSISEIFTMMNYVQPDVLDRYKVAQFDAWVGAFGQIENSMELSPTGDKYQPKKRFKKFTNLPELMKIYKETADIQTSDMLDLPVPEANIIPVESELTDSQRDYLADLVDRSDRVKAGVVEPTEDNMLKITSEARKLAIDMRLLDDSYDLSDNNKLLQVVDNVERIYYEGDENQVTQMIFSDIGTPKTKTNQGNYDVYNELRNLLIERGIPAQEIAFVHDANTDEKKNTLSRKVNAGEVRVLLASTEKGGTGLNVQRKMKAVHHLDVPWRPSDLTQRNGRLIRQGNENKEVEIYHYITKGSFDNFLWETQEKKLKYITQIMTSKDPVRSAEDIDEQTMTASDFKALATGNPYLRKKMELENQLNLLENQKRAFNRNQDNARDILSKSKEKLPALEDRLKKFDQDKLLSSSSKESDFSIELGGKVFDKKDEAGLYLHALIKANISDTKELRTLGTYRGFKLKALTQGSRPAIFDFGETLLKPTFTVQVVGANQYPVTLDLESGIGSIRRIDNVVDGIEKEEAKTQSLIASYQTHAAAAQDTLSKTFPMAEYQRVKEQYNLLAPLIEAGESVETIEAAVRNYLDCQELPLEQSHSTDLTL